MCYALLSTRVEESALFMAMQVIDDEKENPGQMAYAYKMTWIWAITLRRLGPGE